MLQYMTKLKIEKLKTERTSRLIIEQQFFAFQHSLYRSYIYIDLQSISIPQLISKLHINTFTGKLGTFRN